MCAFCRAWNISTNAHLCSSGIIEGGPYQIDEESTTKTDYSAKERLLFFLKKKQETGGLEEWKYQKMNKKLL